MESDDDVLLSSPLVGDSLPVPQRKLKRLKKAITVSLEDRIEIGDLDTGAKNFSEFDDPLLKTGFGSEGFAGKNTSESGFSGLIDEEEEEEGSRAKRALNFGSFAGEESGEIGEEEIADLRSSDLAEEENGDEKNQAQKKKRKERVNDEGENDEKINEKPLNKRRLEKERQENLKQLFAESQRLLRETRDASFKPAPVVKKPISSVLEKIRKRKFELSKKYESNRRLCSGYNNDDESSREVESGNENESKNVEALNTETIASPLVGDLCTDSPCKGEKSPEMALNEESKQEFRAPIDDTQDLFSDSQTSDSIVETPSCPLVELIAPSRIPLNLQLDSEPPDDVLSDDDDDEDYDKENIDPSPRGSADLSSSPTGEAVRTFVDDEAEEEDDSDKENDEDEDDGDIEELRDLIATGYEEKSIDNEKRNELHQKWLEQQDADGTENLLQKLKQGSNKVRKPTLIEDEEEEEEEEEEVKEERKQGEELEESGDEGGEDLAPSTLVKINLRKAKQMMAQMFTDDDEGYVSSSDGEETEEKLTKQYFLEKAKKKAALFSPAEDESSREVFGRIKKLNVAPENKKRAKTQSYFDMSHIGLNRSISSKSSFLGRGISASVASSKKQGSMAVRSFIFERDDSNSKSSKSASTESTETIQVENRHRTVSAKFVSSQTRTFTQNPESTALRSETSLLDLLKRSSFAAASKRGALDSVVPQTESILSSFKLVKKPLNSRQGRWS